MNCFFGGAYSHNNKKSAKTNRFGRKNTKKREKWACGNADAKSGTADCRPAAPNGGNGVLLSLHNRRAYGNGGGVRLRFLRLRLTLLAPEIVHAILAGTLEKSIPQRKFRQEFPVRWSEQKRFFGIE